MIPLLTGEKQRLRVFLAFGGVLLGSLATALFREQYTWLALPLAFAALLAVLNDYRWLYYLLLASLPFSLELSLPGGFSLFVPTEPLVVVLACCGLASWLQGSFSHPPFPSRHTLVLLLMLSLGWACFSTLFSVDHLKSVKYLVAQVLYIGVFFGLSYAMLPSPADIRRIWRLYLLALGVVLLLVLGRHLLTGFSFALVNKVVSPFFLNHVVYAVVSGLSLPLALYLVWHNRRHRLLPLWLFISAIILAAILFSYTRATWLALPATATYLMLLRKKWLKPSLALVFLVLTAAFLYLQHQNRYLAFAPDYEKTIFHKGDLEKHLQATYKFEDVSGMERVYRWVAALRMGADKPWTGTGPSTFYPVYKKYTVKSFRTYVSDNPEQSTTHNTFLLHLAEQGLPGF
ncbi:MAG: O-antigen ligase family protein, partial [Adhaeribacter sp.]